MDLASIILNHVVSRPSEKHHVGRRVPSIQMDGSTGRGHRSTSAHGLILTFGRSLCQRHGAAWETIWQKLVDEVAIGRRTCTSDAKNQLRNKSGYLPRQWVFGTQMRMPGDMFDSHLRPEEFHNTIADEKALQRSLQPSSKRVEPKTYMSRGLDAHLPREKAGQGKKRTTNLAGPCRHRHWQRRAELLDCSRTLPPSRT